MSAHRKQRGDDGSVEPIAVKVKTYTIKDWCEFLGASRTTVWRYIESGYIPKPDAIVPRPRWYNAPSLAGFQSNQSTSASS